MNNKSDYTQCVPEFPLKRKPRIVLGWGVAGFGMCLMFLGFISMTEGMAAVGVMILGLGAFVFWVGASGAKDDTFRICPVCRCEVMEKDYRRRCPTCGAVVGKPFVPKQG